MKIISVVLTTFENFEKVVRNIVNSPEYSHLRKEKEGAFESFYERLVEWMGKLISDAFEGNGYTQEDGKLISSLFIIFINKIK